MADYSRSCEEYIATQEQEDHERAFFDSADWALCKQGAGVNQKSTVAIETLQPKSHQHSLWFSLYGHESESSSSPVSKSCRCLLRHSSPLAGRSRHHRHLHSLRRPQMAPNHSLSNTHNQSPSHLCIEIAKLETQISYGVLHYILFVSYVLPMLQEMDLISLNQGWLSQVMHY
ncbi:unnamed protein product [Camellia sinensis]